ncbi:MAG: hypothetical protein ACON5H_12260 [Akkermansiaceae bacterium]
MNRLLTAISGIFLALSAGGLTSCGLAQSAMQLPMRTGQSLGRSIGVNLEHQNQDIPAPAFRHHEH